MQSSRCVLAFDTSAAHCAAALLCGERLLGARLEPMKRGQAEALVPMIEALLAEAGLTPRDLDAIGCGTGPGNFTGIRISVALARGMALSLGVPAIGVSQFELLAPARGAALKANLKAMISKDSQLKAVTEEHETDAKENEATIA